jgi:hypothetical protein
MLDPGALYHLGVVVSDLDEALADLGRRYGLTWGPRHDAQRTVWLDGTVVEVGFRTCFGVQAPHLEIIEAVPGTIWQQPSGSALHHLGYWTDDVASCSERLEAAGSPLAACGVAADGTYPGRFAYHHDPRGYFVEVVSSSIGAEMEARWQPAG